MRALIGLEEPVDPPVRWRPLTASRAWLAAFVLGMLVVAWFSAVGQLDQQNVRAGVDELESIIGDLEKAVAGDKDYLVDRRFEELRTLVEAPPTGSDPAVARAWQDVRLITARVLDPSQAADLALTIGDLRAASNELRLLVPHDRPVRVR
ncbi:MAG: hypothetical protein OEX04_07365 [Acidimicrobiia bacterium]|nr:hypothetical protein [Acidimicrobiia bacterium]MDH5292923.1 hypothetical protein [Acidimicrobiia bacterium]